jgi:hypothetical protein
MSDDIVRAREIAAKVQREMGANDVADIIEVEGFDNGSAVRTALAAIAAERARCADAAFHAHNPDEQGDGAYSVGHHDGVNAAVAAIRARHDGG